MADVIIIGKKTRGQAMPKGKIVAQKKHTHERQAAKAQETTMASSGPVAVTKKDYKVISSRRFSPG